MARRHVHKSEARFFSARPVSNALLDRIRFLLRLICSQLFKCLWFVSCFEDRNTRNTVALIYQREKQVSQHRVLATISLGPPYGRAHDVLKRSSGFRLKFSVADQLDSLKIIAQSRFDGHEIGSTPRKVGSRIAFDKKLERDVLQRDDGVAGFSSSNEGAMQNTFDVVREGHGRGLTNWLANSRC